jgi:hypothetical protein
VEQRAAGAVDEPGEEVDAALGRPANAARPTGFDRLASGGPECLGDDRRVPTRHLFGRATVGHEANVEPISSKDVLHRIPSPWICRASRDAVALQVPGDVAHRAERGLTPHPPHDVSLALHDREGPRPDDRAFGITNRLVAERIHSRVTTGLKDGAGEADHALRVEIALELGGQGELAKHVPPDRAVPRRVGHCRNPNGDRAALEFRLERKHESRVAREPAEVVDRDTLDRARCDSRL